MRGIIAMPSQESADEAVPDEPTPQALTIDAAAGAGERLDRFLAARLDGVSRTRLQQWIALGAVRCDERTLQASTRLAGTERIVVEPQPLEAETAFAPDPVALDIVHEDDDLLVVCKPAGLVVHPAAGNWRGTLMNGLLYHRSALARLPRAGIVHRLDRDTSGLLVVAKTARAFTALSAQLAERSMGRRYLALAQGVCPAEGVVDAPIGRDPSVRVRMAVVNPPRGRIARTMYRRLATALLEGCDVSLLECRLDTGRTHQIRVHLRSIGHALVGDALYGGASLGGLSRQALHAWRLSLRHPADGRAMQWQAAVPEDLRSVFRLAGIDTEMLEPLP